MTWNADLIEVTWIVFSLAGGLLALTEKMYARRDRRLALAAGLERPDLLLELAVIDIDRALARWIIAAELANLIAGVTAALLPGAPGGRPWQSWLIISCLIFSAGALPAMLADRRRRRNRLLCDRRLDR